MADNGSLEQSAPNRIPAPGRGPKRINNFFNKLKHGLRRNRGKHKRAQEALLQQTMTVDEDGANQPLTAPVTLLRKGKASVDGQLSLQLATLHLMFRSEDGTQTEAKAPSSRHASVASADGNSNTTAAAALCLDILSLRDVRAGVKARRSEKFEGTLDEGTEQCAMMVFYESKFVPASACFLMSDAVTAKQWEQELSHLISQRHHLCLSQDGVIVPSALDEAALPMLLSRVWMHARKLEDVHLRDSPLTVLSPGVISDIAARLGISLDARQVSDVIGCAITSLSTTSPTASSAASSRRTSRDPGSLTSPATSMPAGKSATSKSTLVAADGGMHDATGSADISSTTTSQGGEWSIEDGLFAVYTAILLLHSDWVFYDRTLRSFVHNTMTHRPLSEHGPIQESQQEISSQAQLLSPLALFDSCAFTVESLSNFLHDVEQESLSHTEYVVARATEPGSDFRTRRSGVLSRGPSASALLLSTNGSRSSLWDSGDAGHGRRRSSGLARHRRSGSGHVVEPVNDDGTGGAEGERARRRSVTFSSPSFSREASAAELVGSPAAGEGDGQRAGSACTQVDAQGAETAPTAPVDEDEKAGVEKASASQHVAEVKRNKQNANEQSSPQDETAASPQPVRKVGANKATTKKSTAAAKAKPGAAAPSTPTRGKPGSAAPRASAQPKAAATPKAERTGAGHRQMGSASARKNAASSGVKSAATKGSSAARQQPALDRKAKRPARTPASSSSSPATTASSASRPKSLVEGRRTVKRPAKRAEHGRAGQRPPRPASTHATTSNTNSRAGSGSGTAVGAGGRGVSSASGAKAQASSARAGAGKPRPRITAAARSSKQAASVRTREGAGKAGNKPARGGQAGKRTGQQNSAVHAKEKTNEKSKKNESETESKTTSSAAMKSTTSETKREHGDVNVDARTCEDKDGGDAVGDAKVHHVNARDDGHGDSGSTHSMQHQNNNNNHNDNNDDDNNGNDNNDDDNHDDHINSSNHNTQMDQAPASARSFRLRNRRSKRLSELKSLMTNRPDTPIHISVVLDYLHSRSNTLIHPHFLTVDDSAMTAPLSHYFISSSHNTYLTGWQYLGESSVEAYARCLLGGCKCVELDLWDGVDGTPVITHGGARCTTISAKEVLYAIKDHAWAVSDFPLILSLENHLSVQQQDLFADMLVEVLGSDLLRDPLPQYPCDGLAHLPSPQELKRKILIKGKKSMAADEEREELGETLNSGLLDIQACSTDDGFAPGAWMQCMFILTQDRLVYAAPMKIASTEAEEEAALRADFDEYLANREAWPPDQRPGQLFMGDLIEVTLPTKKMDNEIRKESGGKRFAFTLSFTSQDKAVGSVQIQLGAESEQQRQEWVQALQQRIASPLQTSTESATNTTPRAPIAKLSAKLCSLVHYTQSVRFRGFEHANATSTAAYMSSFSEKKMGKIIHKSSDKLSAFTERHLARVYPSYHRFKSANYDPQVHWNYGCQFVALNWQTPCDEMWLNRHFFARNGNCGYVRKPAYMLKEDFDPYSEKGLQPVLEHKEPLFVRVRVLEARHLPVSAKLTSNLSCTVSLSCAPVDAVPSQEATCEHSKNHLNPSFNLDFVCEEVYMPEVATLMIKVHNKKTVIAQTGCPISVMRPGCRSLALYDEHNVDLPLASVLLMVEIKQNEEEWWPVHRDLAHIGRRRAIRSKDRPTSPRRPSASVEEDALHTTASEGEMEELNEQLREHERDAEAKKDTDQAEAQRDQEQKGLDAEAEAEAKEKEEGRRRRRRARLANIQSKIKQYIDERVASSEETAAGREYRAKHPRFVGLGGETSIDVSGVTSRVADYIAQPLAMERRNKDAGFKKQHPRFVGLKRVSAGDAEGEEEAPASTSATPTMGRAKKSSPTTTLKGWSGHGKGGTSPVVRKAKSAGGSAKRFTPAHQQRQDMGLKKQQLPAHKPQQHKASAGTSSKPPARRHSAGQPVTGARERAGSGAGAVRGRTPSKAAAPAAAQHAKSGVKGARAQAGTTPSQATAKPKQAGLEPTSAKVANEKASMPVGKEKKPTPRATSPAQSSTATEGHAPTPSKQRTTTQPHVRREAAMKMHPQCHDKETAAAPTQTKQTPATASPQGGGAKVTQFPAHGQQQQQQQQKQQLLHDLDVEHEETDV